MEAVTTANAKQTAALRAQGETVQTMGQQVAAIAADLASMSTSLATSDANLKASNVKLATLATMIFGLHQAIADLKEQIEAGQNADLSDLLAAADAAKAQADTVLADTAAEGAAVDAVDPTDMSVLNPVPAEPTATTAPPAVG